MDVHEASLVKIREVTGRVSEVDFKMERMPMRVRDLLTLLAVRRWQERAFHSKEKLQNFKVFASSLRYDCAGLIEALMRLLFELDSVESFGDQEVRAARKEVIGGIQERITTLEGHLHRIDAIIKRLQGWLDSSPPQVDVPAPSEAIVECHQEPEKVEVNQEGDVNMETESIPQEMTENGSMDTQPCVEPVTDTQPCVEPASDEQPQVMEEEAEKKGEEPKSPVAARKRSSPSSSEDTSHKKHMWTPSSQSYVRGSKFVVAVNLPGVAPSDIEVGLEEDEQSGDKYLVVRGHRRPSQQEIMLVRMGYRSKIQPARPFETKIVLPAESIHLGSMRALMEEDNVLRVYFERVAREVPSVCRDASRRKVPATHNSRYYESPHQQRRAAGLFPFHSMFTF